MPNCSPSRWTSSISSPRPFGNLRGLTVSIVAEPGPVGGPRPEPPVVDAEELDAQLGRPPCQRDLALDVDVEAGRLPGVVVDRPEGRAVALRQHLGDLESVELPRRAAEALL